MIPRLLFAVVGVASAQQRPWAPCGGGAACTAGYSCVSVGGGRSQCQPDGPGGRGLAGSSGTFTFFGASESGAEFGSNIPGRFGSDYIFPSKRSIDTLVEQGYNAFRIPFRIERLADSLWASTFDAAYLAQLTEVVNHITGKGAYAVVDPHNYARFRGDIINDTAAFRSFWTNLAGVFRENSRVVFDTNNEFHDMDQDLVFRLNQAAIDGIRASGAKQWIFVEGNSWSGAWTWEAVNDNLKDLVDPQHRIAYEMHQYLDADATGSSEECVSTKIGAERASQATQWLRRNGKVAVLGEYAGGANEQCRAAVKDLLDHLRQNVDVWIGAFWWGAGPWWGQYLFTFEPPGGKGYVYYNDLLKTYMASDPRYMYI